MNPWTNLPQILIGELSRNTEMLLDLKNNKQRIPRKEKLCQKYHIDTEITQYTDIKTFCA